MTAAVAFALLLTGCGGGSDEPDPAASTAASSAAEQAGLAGREVLLEGQQLTVLDQPVTYPKKQPAQVSSYVVTLEPGQETGWHKHKTPLFVYVLEGTLTVEYDAGVTKEFAAGTAYLEADDVWHNVTNMGSDTVRTLDVSMGAKGAKDTVQRAG